MSTFSSWQGPGDFAGDLTMFYQAIKGVEAHITAVKNEITAINAKDGAQDIEMGRLITLIDTANSSINVLNDMWNRVNGQVQLDNGTGNLQVGTLSAQMVDAANFHIPNLLADEVHISKMYGTQPVTWLETIPPAVGTVKSRLYSMVDWLLTSQKVQLNRIVSYDAVEFRSQRHDKEVFLNTSPSGTTHTDAMNDAAINVSSDGEIIVAVLVESDIINPVVGIPRHSLGLHAGGVGTIYLSVRDSINIEAVINVSAQWQHIDNNFAGLQHNNEDVHGSLSVNFSYTSYPVATMQGVRFRLYSGTATATKPQDGSLLGTAYNQGDACVIVTCELIGQKLHNTLVGDMFFVGKGLKRFEFLHDQSVTNGSTYQLIQNIDQINWGDLLEEVESLPGDGVSGGCHGNLISGVRLNNLDVRYDARIRENLVVNHALGVGPTADSIETDPTVLPGDALFEGDVIIKRGAEINAPLRVKPQIMTARPGGSTPIAVSQPVQVDVDAYLNENLFVEKDLMVKGATHLKNIYTDNIHTAVPNAQNIIRVERSGNAPAVLHIGDATV